MGVHVTWLGQGELVHQLPQHPVALARQIVGRVDDGHGFVYAGNERLGGAAGLVGWRSLGRRERYVHHDGLRPRSEQIHGVRTRRRGAQPKPRQCPAGAGRCPHHAGAFRRGITALVDGSKRQRAVLGARQHVDVPSGTVGHDDRQDPVSPGAGAARRVVVGRCGQVDRVTPRLADLERFEAGVVLWRGTVFFVHLLVAIVVARVATNLGSQAGHQRIGLVAIAAAGAVPHRIAIPIGVPWLVLARAGLFHTAVYRAGRGVGARHGVARTATQAWLALLDPVAVRVVGASLVIGRMATATQLEIAAVERALDAVVALAVVDARPPQGRIGITSGICWSVDPNVG